MPKGSLRMVLMGRHYIELELQIFESRKGLRSLGAVYGPADGISNGRGF